MSTTTLDAQVRGSSPPEAPGVLRYGIAAQWRHKAGDRSGYTDHGGRTWHLWDVPEALDPLVNLPGIAQASARSKDLEASLSRNLPKCGRRARLAGAPPIVPSAWVAPTEALGLPRDVRPRRVCSGCATWVAANVDPRCDSRRYDQGGTRMGGHRYATTYGGDPKRAQEMRALAVRSWRCDGDKGHDGQHLAVKARRRWS